MKSLRVLAALLALGLGGCGKGGVQAPDFTPELLAVKVAQTGTLNVPLGRTTQLDAVGTYTNPPGSDTATFDKETEAEWTSSAPDVATVDVNGKLTGKKAGTATITAKKKSKVSDPVNVVVGPAVVSSINIQPPNPVVGLGATQEFTLQVALTDGTTRNATGADFQGAVTWVTDPANGSVLTLSGTSGLTNTGTGISRGSATITVSATNAIGESVTGSTAVTVGDATPISITSLEPNPLLVPLGTTRTFTAKGTLSDGTPNVTIPNNLLNWAITSGSPTDVVTVNATTGDITAVKKGTTNVTATLKNNSNSSASAAVNVVDATLQQIILVLDGTTTPLTTLDIPLNTTKRIRALGIYSGSSTPQEITHLVNCPSATPPQTGAAAVSWVSSQPATVSVNPASGPITDARGLVQDSTGSVKITASVLSPECTPVSKDLPVTVSSATFQDGQITFTPAFVQVGLTTTLKVTAQLSNGTTATIANTDLNFSTPADPTIAAFDNQPAGIIKGLKKGTTTVTATLKDGVAPTITGPNRTATGTITVTDSECTTPLQGANAQVFTSANDALPGTDLTGLGLGDLLPNLCLGDILGDLLCGVSHPENLIDGNDATNATIYINLGLLGASRAGVVVRQTNLPKFPAGVPAGFRVAFPAGFIADASLLKNLTVYVFDSTDPTKFDARQTDDTVDALRLSLLGTTLIGTNPSEVFLISFTPKVAFDSIGLTLNGGLLAALTNVDVLLTCGTAAVPATTP